MHAVYLKKKCRQFLLVSMAHVVQVQLERPKRLGTNLAVRRVFIKAKSVPFPTNREHLKRAEKGKMSRHRQRSTILTQTPPPRKRLLGSR